MGPTRIWLYSVLSSYSDESCPELSNLSIAAFVEAQDAAGRGIRRVTVLADLLTPLGDWRDLSCRARDLARCLGWHEHPALEDPPLDPPESPPAVVSDLQVEFQVPKAGWCPVQITAGKASVAFDVSNVFGDPFILLPWWLESCAAGWFPSIRFDDEHEIHRFALLRARPPHVRFVVEASDGLHRRIELDIEIGRKALVASIYRRFLALWESAAYRAGCREWDEFADWDGDGALTPYPVRRAALDDFVAGYRATRRPAAR